MGRVVAAVVVGYVLITLVVMLGLAGWYQLFGSERAFRADAHEDSAGWIAATAATGLVAAVLGGRICRLVAGSSRAPLILAAVVFFLGIAMAIPELVSASPAASRPAGAGMMNAVQDPRRPAHAALLDSVVGVVGVLLGGRSRPSRKAGQQADASRT